MFFLFTSGCLFNSIAEQSESKKPQLKIDEKTTVDNIFNDIMLSLPDNVKNKLDSIKLDHNRRNISNPENMTTNKLNIAKRNDLSQDLRIKVEKAMKEIDFQQQKRQLQFKESKKRK